MSLLRDYSVQGALVSVMVETEMNEKLVILQLTQSPAGMTCCVYKRQVAHPQWP